MQDATCLGALYEVNGVLFLTRPVVRRCCATRVRNGGRGSFILWTQDNFLRNQVSEGGSWSAVGYLQQLVNSWSPVVGARLRCSQVVVGFMQLWLVHAQVMLEL